MSDIDKYWISVSETGLDVISHALEESAEQSDSINSAEAYREADGNYRTFMDEIIKDGISMGMEEEIILYEDGEERMYQILEDSHEECELVLIGDRSLIGEALPWLETIEENNLDFELENCYIERSGYEYN